VIHIPKVELIKTSSIPPDPNYSGLRIIRFQSDEQAQQNYVNNRYQCLHQPEEYSIVRATVCRKGVSTNPSRRRIVAVIHPTLKQFTDLVQYDPSSPPPNNFQAAEMKMAHDQTQSDFKGAKSANKADFANYILQGLTGARPVYLPMVSGWQSTSVFERTIFVAFDEEDPNAMYGRLFLPKLPIMQADGQTQTAALFQVAHSADAQATGALDSLCVTLEIELNVDERRAGQSFADRNGRGSKKNLNLVIGMDTSSALSELRMQAIKDTVFEKRLATGRSTGTSETATGNIVDLSTMEQMLLNVISGGRKKPEHIQHEYVPHFVPYVKEFLTMLDETFSASWLKDTPEDKDTFRRLYVHGWPFALKAIALAYYEARIDVLGPLGAAIGAKSALKTTAQAFEEAAEEARKSGKFKKPTVDFEELKARLKAIDWHRYRKHWVQLTGPKMGKDGKPRPIPLKGSGEMVVLGQAQNTNLVIDAVAAKLLSATWNELCSTENYPLSK
jgi:hypothetical protein